MLKANFERIGPGARKIERGEFAIEDFATRRDINLSSSWESCFRPGQRVGMSMIFNAAKSIKQCCPGCGQRVPDGFTEGIDIECGGPDGCGMISRHAHASIRPFRKVLPTTNPEQVEDLQGIEVRNGPVPGQTTRQTPQDSGGNSDLALFRRVRINTSIGWEASSPTTLSSSAPPWQAPPTFVQEFMTTVASKDGYDLPCQFIFAGCALRFRALDVEAWISHSMSHFLNAPLPTTAICTFCDAATF